MIREHYINPPARTPLFPQVRSRCSSSQSACPQGPQTPAGPPRRSSPRGRRGLLAGSSGPAPSACDETVCPAVPACSTATAGRNHPNGSSKSTHPQPVAVAVLPSAGCELFCTSTEPEREGGPAVSAIRSIKSCLGRSAQNSSSPWSAAFLRFFWHFFCIFAFPAFSWLPPSKLDAVAIVATSQYSRWRIVAVPRLRLRRGRLIVLHGAELAFWVLLRQASVFPHIDSVVLFACLGVST